MQVRPSRNQYSEGKKVLVSDRTESSDRAQCRRMRYVRTSRPSITRFLATEQQFYIPRLSPSVLEGNVHEIRSQTPEPGT